MIVYPQSRGLQTRGLDPSRFLRYVPEGTKGDGTFHQVSWRYRINHYFHIDVFELALMLLFYCCYHQMLVWVALWHVTGSGDSCMTIQDAEYCIRMKQHGAEQWSWWRGLQEIGSKIPEQWTEDWWLLTVVALRKTSSMGAGSCCLSFVPGREAGSNNSASTT